MLQHDWSLLLAFEVNSVVIQTGSTVKEGKLSELGAASDRFSGNGVKAVRTRFNFGQVQRSRRKSCPNSVQLRTGSAVTEGKLSELGAASDRFSGYRGKAVRTR
ncbi:hypothetical protein [Mesobacillus jeotgali]|uniref:Uncharacterized protein n=1 Tax=Mesobacillus jeotgali TaxID=129985 RepID=A0ABY9VL97_9BACI|nr:hypothetical protein [Mesobacillus jeotgali]WNF23909.1 hypothetical protein RH061_05300 [Mesobacillus jeotgali]